MTRYVLSQHKTATTAITVNWTYFNIILHGAAAP
jgi:hypothetical protein